MNLRARPATDCLLALVILVMQGLLLTSCVGGFLYGTGESRTDSVSEGTELVPAPRAPALPPLYLRAGQELMPEGMHSIFKHYDYIIVDRGGRDANMTIQAELFRMARASLKEAEQQGLTHKTIPVREPALVLEGLSMELNPAALASSESSGQPEGTVADPALSESVKTRFAPLLAETAVTQPGSDLPVRGLSLPDRVLSLADQGGTAAVAVADRRFMPPVILPMPEEAMMDDTPPAAPLPVPQGSSETAVLREVPPSNARNNLLNSAMAWEAVQLAHDDVARPLFLALNHATFDNGRGLAEAIAYFDSSSRILQVILVDAHPEKRKTEDGRNTWVLAPDRPLPVRGTGQKHAADYIFVLVQPGTAL